MCIFLGRFDAHAEDGGFSLWEPNPFSSYVRHKRVRLTNTGEFLYHGSQEALGKNVFHFTLWHLLTSVSDTVSVSCATFKKKWKAWGAICLLGFIMELRISFAIQSLTYTDSEKNKLHVVTNSIKFFGLSQGNIYNKFKFSLSICPEWQHSLRNHWTSFLLHSQEGVYEYPTPTAMLTKLAWAYSSHSCSVLQIWFSVRFNMV